MLWKQYDVEPLEARRMLSLTFFNAPVARPAGIPLAPPESRWPIESALADVNGDGRLDVVYSSMNSSNLCVYLNKGHGKFTGPKLTPAPTGVTFGPPATADFDADGLADVVVGTNGGYDIFRSRGDGHFDFVKSGGGFGAPVTGDFNGDGLPDFANATGGGFRVILNDGAWSFSSPRDVQTDGDEAPNTSYDAYVIRAGDINGDGRPDVALVRQTTRFADDGSELGADFSIEAYFSNSDGTFKHAVHYIVPHRPYDFTIADVDGDGRVDIILGGVALTLDAFGTEFRQGVMTVVLQRPNHTFKLLHSYVHGPSANEVSESGWVRCGDFNGDGHVDVVLGSQDTHTMTLFLGHGDGTFDQARGLRLVHSTSAVVADFDGDGKLDLALCDRDNDEIDFVFGR